MKYVPGSAPPPERRCQQVTDGVPCRLQLFWCGIYGKKEAARTYFKTLLAMTTEELREELDP